MTSGLTSPTTRRWNSRSVEAAERRGHLVVSIGRTSRARGSPVDAAASQLGRHGRAGLLDELGQASEACRTLGRQPGLSIAGASMVAAGAQTDRPTSTPLAPARHADLHLGLERRVVHAARQQDPGKARGSIELVAGIRPGRAAPRRSGRTGIPPSGHRRRWPSGAGPSRPRRAASSSPVTGSPSSPKESGSTKSARSSRTAGRCHLLDEALLVRGVRCVRVVVDQEFRGRGPQALRLLRIPAWQQATDAGRRGTLVAGRLEGDEQAIRPESEPSAMHWAAPTSGSRSVPVASVASARTTVRLKSTMSSIVVDSGASGWSSLRRFWRWSRARTVNVPRADEVASRPRRVPSNSAMRLPDG